MAAARGACSGRRTGCVLGVTARRVARALVMAIGFAPTVALAEPEFAASGYGTLGYARSDDDLRYLRYIDNTGGRMPEETRRILRAQLPKTRPFLMYGLTEAFRSTYLPPEEGDRRPDSSGQAIPNAEILVLRDAGTPCPADKPGEPGPRGPRRGLGDADCTRGELVRRWLEGLPKLSRNRDGVQDFFRGFS